MKKALTWTGLLVTLFALLSACGRGTASIAEGGGEEQIVKIGVVGDDLRDWEPAIARLKKENITLDFVKFSDYNQPNEALANGDVDLNSFQHQAYLDKFNEQFNKNLVSIGNTVIAPLAIYSKQIKSLDDIKKGDEVLIPNDVTNGGRALILLQEAGLLKVDKKAGITPTVKDILANPLALKITEVDASQTARGLNDATFAVINSGFAVDAGLDPAEEAIFSEPVNERSKPYVNIIVARPDDERTEILQKVVAAYQQDDTEQALQEKSKGANVAAWKTFGQK